MTEDRQVAAFDFRNAAISATAFFKDSEIDHGSHAGKRDAFVAALAARKAA